MSELQIVEYSDKDYKMNIEKENVRGSVDAIEAVKQAAFKILNTERYDNIIYSWNYGVETNDLYGMPMSYVQPEIKRRFTEALMQDDRIKEVSDFEFEVKGHELTVSFIITCDYGKFGTERTVTV
jgi:hypothetical protein